MDIAATIDELVKAGYRRIPAQAKVAHDIILSAIKAAGMKERITIKGGVVMSGLTKLVRRATIDMDVDLVHYSLRNDAIEKFVRLLDKSSDCTIAIDGPITDLKQADYKGKRLYLRATDDKKKSVVTKMDIGVHADVSIAQRDFVFDVVTDTKSVKLLANSKEQIFVEKLKSLLRLGTLSTRYKDVFDMYFLSQKINRRTLKAYISHFIYSDKKMREKDASAILRRLQSIFDDRLFKRELKKKKHAWLDTPPDEVTSALLNFIEKLA